MWLKKPVYYKKIFSFLRFLDFIYFFLLFLRFLPRDAIRKRGLCCRPVSVRPSVCPSGWCIVSRWLKISSNFFSWPGSPMILVFLTLPIPNSKGNPFSRSAKYAEWEKLTIFELNRRLSRKRCEIVRWLLWNVNRNKCVPDRIVSF